VGCYDGEADGNSQAIVAERIDVSIAQAQAVPVIVVGDPDVPDADREFSYPIQPAYYNFQKRLPEPPHEQSAVGALRCNLDASLVEWEERAQQVTSTDDIEDRQFGTKPALSTDRRFVDTYLQVTNCHVVYSPSSRCSGVPA